MFQYDPDNPPTCASCSTVLFMEPEKARKRTYGARRRLAAPYLLVEDNAAGFSSVKNPVVYTGQVTGGGGQSHLTEVPMSEVLNRVLHLPPGSTLTEDLSFCLVCTQAVGQLYQAQRNLEIALEVNSSLQVVVQKIEMALKLGFPRVNVPGGVMRIVTPTSLDAFHPVLIPTPTEAEKNAVKLVLPCGKGEDVKVRPEQVNIKAEPDDESEAMDEDSGSVPMSSPAASDLTSPNETDASDAVSEEDKPSPKPKKKRKARIRHPRKQGPIITYTHPPCPHCGKVLRNRQKRGLERHIEFSHKFRSKITCDICGRPIQSYVVKAIHAKSHMSQAERAAAEEPGTKVECPHCGKTVTQHSLRNHMKTHRSAEERIIRCTEPFCDFTCVALSSLRRHHEQVHEEAGASRYKCPKCDTGFRLHAQLKEHQMSWCEAWDRPHACLHCVRKFKLKQALVFHYITVHKLGPQVARDSVYPELAGKPIPVWLPTRRRRERPARKKRKNRPIT